MALGTRFTHSHSGELVVFLIGMRINTPWRPDLWMPALAAMPRMLAELSHDPDSGLLGYRMAMSADGPSITQYWSSMEKLQAYASAPGGEHRPAWTDFNRRARTAAGAVGIWHETFQVARAESVYLAMPVLGLARATSVLPLVGKGSRSRDRIRSSPSLVPDGGSGD
jgi:hypothetical protein